MSQHGQLDINMPWRHSRICNIHGHHGQGYVCKYYSRYLKNKIKRDWNLSKKTFRVDILCGHKINPAYEIGVL